MVFVKTKGSTPQTPERVFVRATEAYLPDDYGNIGMEKLFDGVKGLPYISDAYLKSGQNSQKDWADFFMKLGAWTSPRVFRQDAKGIQPHDERHSWVPFQYSTRNEHELIGDWVSPDQVGLFSICSELAE